MTIKIGILVRLMGMMLGFTALLLLARVAYSGHRSYLFLGWNLFLAGIPLLASSYLLQVKRSIGQGLVFMGWLLFFPDALYLITDLVHIREGLDVPL